MLFIFNLAYLKNKYIFLFFFFSNSTIVRREISPSNRANLQHYSSTNFREKDNPKSRANIVPKRVPDRFSQLFCFPVSALNKLFSFVLSFASQLSEVDSPQDVSCQSGCCCCQQQDTIHTRTNRIWFSA